MHWIESMLGVLCLWLPETIGHHGPNFEETKLIGKLNISNDSPILMGVSDQIYYFVRPCTDSEITMVSADGDYKWTTEELKFANKTFPAFAIYADLLSGDEREDVYSMIIAVDGSLFKYNDEREWELYLPFGPTNRRTYEGSNTFHNFDEKIWYSPSKPSKLYQSLRFALWNQFDSTNGNFVQLTDNAKDVELFPLAYLGQVKWTLLVLKKCGAISYHMGDITNSKFNRLSGPHEFMQAENINDFSVCSRDNLIGYFNTYLRRSSKDCPANKWNAVIPVRKELSLGKTKAGDYRLTTTFSNAIIGTPIQKFGFDVSTNNPLAEQSVLNFYIKIEFALGPSTSEIGLIARQNRNKVGVTVGLNLKDGYYYYNKGSDYKTPKEQEICDCGCPVSKNVSVSYDISKIRFEVIADGPVIDAICNENLVFTFFAFRDHEDNGISIYSKGSAKATFSLYKLD